MVEGDNNFKEKATSRVRQNGSPKRLGAPSIQRSSGIAKEDSRELGNWRMETG